MTVADAGPDGPGARPSVPLTVRRWLSVVLHRHRSSALLWLLTAGGSAVYLGSMDLLYDLQHGVFTRGGAGAFELVVVALTWVFATVVLTTAWRHRTALLAADGS